MSREHSREHLASEGSEREKAALRRVKETLLRQTRSIRSRWRKLVTGHEETRVRDFVREKEHTPSYAKLFDKVAFTLGVLNIVMCQYFLLSIPQYFARWYVLVMPVMLATRAYHFKSQHWHYFLFDFCYFGVTLSMLNVLVFRESEALFKICYIFSTGVLPVAIPLWRNSFIFHDFDKITSVYIHLLPCMLYHTLRFHAPPFCLDSPCAPLTIWDYLRALAVYLLWQSLYLLKTEVLDREEFELNPQLITSLRWLSSDTKNAFARAMLRTLRRWRIFGESEEYDAQSIKTKLVFVATQLALTIVCFAPTAVLYSSASASLLHILALFTMAVYNGAAFYIEVFSVRYATQLHRLEEMQKLARDAQRVAQDLVHLSDEPVAQRTTRSDSEIDREGKMEGESGSESEAEGEQKYGIECEEEDDYVSAPSESESVDDVVDASRELLRTSADVWRELRSQTRSLQDELSNTHSSFSLSQRDLDE